MILAEAVQVLATHPHTVEDYVITASLYSGAGYILGLITGKLWCRIHNQRRKDCDHV